MCLLSKLKTKIKSETLTILSVLFFVLVVALAYGKLISLAVEATSREYTVEQDDGH